MKKQIRLNNEKLEYTLKLSKRARRVRLSVHSSGELIITTPRNVSQNFIEKFIIEKSNWILKKIEYFKNNSYQFFKQDNNDDYLALKNQALALAHTRVGYFSKLYNFKVRKISIKNQKTRWGSCSKKGNLNFNYKIVKLPEKLADYIIIHELCHLKEFNHSRKFWRLVADITPDYLELRKQLKSGNINAF